MGFKIRNVSTLRAELNDRERLAPKLLAGALTEEAETILRKSRRLVPVDTGTLRASGHVKPPETKGDQIIVRMGYGGAASAYALVQHERTDYVHPGQGQAHYLSQPANEAASGFSQRVARRIRRRLERG